jgi:hypothetical protein
MMGFLNVAPDLNGRETSLKFRFLSAMMGTPSMDSE